MARLPPSAGRRQKGENPSWRSGPISLWSAPRLSGNGSDTSCATSLRQCVGCATRPRKVLHSITTPGASPLPCCPPAPRWPREHMPARCRGSAAVPPCLAPRPPAPPPAGRGRAPALPSAAGPAPACQDGSPSGRPARPGRDRAAAAAPAPGPAAHAPPGRAPPRGCRHATPLNKEAAPRPVAGPAGAAHSAGRAPPAARHRPAAPGRVAAPARPAVAADQAAGHAPAPRRRAAGAPLPGQDRAAGPGPRPARAAAAIVRHGRGPA